MDLDHGQREAKAKLVIDPHFDGVDPVLLKLKATEDVNVCGMGVEGRKRELNFTLGNRVFVIGIQDQRVLTELADSPAPAGPETELEKSDRRHRGRDDTHDADERLLPAGFLANILAEHTGLEVRQNFLRHAGITHQFLRAAQNKLGEKCCPAARRFPASSPPARHGLFYLPLPSPADIVLGYEH